MPINAGKQHKEAEACWRKICQLNREIEKELLEVKKNGGQPTKRYKTLQSDMNKLRAEYQKITRSQFSSLSIEQGEAITRNKVMGDLLGRSGPDSHHNPNEDLSKRHV